MKIQLNKSLIERFSRQIILKDIGIMGQKKILSSKVLIVGVGGLGSPAADFLSRAGIGTIGIVDNDKVGLSNLHRQSLYNTSDIGKFKVKIAKDKIKKINPNTRVKIYKIRLNNINFKKIIDNYDYIVDGSDNFKTKFLINNKDRIAQMILTPVIKMNLEESENLPETIRGEGGFGSTGK